MGPVQTILDEIGAVVLERGWSSSNNIVFGEASSDGATLVDTGYVTHVEQTISLVGSALRGQHLARIVNTHLHSDHVGGNAAIQRRWDCEVLVPETTYDAVRDWDHDRLSYRFTDQRCDRFEPTASLSAGSSIDIGGRLWWALAAPGHDADALMFFEPRSGVLISGDALWEDRLAVIFPETEGRDGFEPAAQALDCIEALNPRLVIPGHGRPFADVRRALAASRLRLATFRDAPERHHQYAARALTVFYVLEHRAVPIVRLLDWLQNTPILIRIHQSLGRGAGTRPEFSASVLDRLLADAVLVRQGDDIMPSPR